MTLPIVNVLLTIAVIGLQAADLWTTWLLVVLRDGRELNPLVRRLMDRFGPGPALVGAKIAAGSVVAWLCVWQPGSPTLTAGLATLVAFYAWVVWHNFRAMRQATPRHQVGSPDSGRDGAAHTKNFRAMRQATSRHQVGSPDSGRDGAAHTKNFRAMRQA